MSIYRVLVPDVEAARNDASIEPEERRRTGHIELLLPSLFLHPLVSLASQQGAATFELLAMAVDRVHQD